MSTSINKTKIEDYERIKQLLQSEEMIGDWFTKELFSKMLNKTNEGYFVAKINNNIVGNIFSSDDGGYYGYISKLMVDKKHRSKGIAQELVKRALERFKARKIEWVFAHVRKDNLPSINLFKKFGIKIRDTHYLIDNR